MRRYGVMAAAAALLLGVTACGAELAAEPAADTSAKEQTTAETSTPEQPAALPDVARVVCDAETTRVETPTVRVHPNGIHLEVVNTTDDRLSFQMSSSDGGMGTGADPGTSRHVLEVPPGTVTVVCRDVFEPEGAGATFEAVDEDAVVYISTRLQCGKTSRNYYASTSAGSYPRGARGQTSDPFEAVREALGRALQPGDVLERAGYADSELLTVRLTREGQVLGYVELYDDGRGKWLRGSVTLCASAHDR